MEVGKLMMYRIMMLMMGISSDQLNIFDNNNASKRD
jgi:hypothetical protein